MIYSPRESDLLMVRTSRTLTGVQNLLYRSQSIEGTELDLMHYTVLVFGSARSFCSSGL